MDKKCNKNKCRIKSSGNMDNDLFSLKKTDPHHCLSDHFRITICSDLLCNTILNVRNLCVLYGYNLLPLISCYTLKLYQN